jgi:hypothetical protein
MVWFTPMNDLVTSQECRNCGSSLTGAYCAHCGQQAVVPPPSVSEFLHEFVTHHVALEGTLWRTLGLLLFKPGALTNEYIAGRRRRYIAPFRLYVTVSFIFFLIHHGLDDGKRPQPITVTQSAVVTTPSTQAAPPSPPAKKIATVPTVPEKGAAEDSDDFNVECNAGTTLCAGVERYVKPRLKAWKDNPAAESKHLLERASNDLPYVAMLMVPVFALLTALAYRSRRRYYGEHLVFAFHVQSFWFILFTLATPLPKSVADLAIFVVLGYTTVALQRTFHGRRWFTMLRSLFIHLSYLICLAFTAAMFGLFLFLT